MSIENEERNCENNNIEENLLNANMNQNRISNCDCNCNDDTRNEMLKNIKCLEFAIIELAQYLDTHPNSEKALCLHNKYCKELKDVKDKYQKKYGPLTINYPCNKWRWIEEPWPWEGGRK